VLDVATGTGLAAEAALDAVGPTGHVTATDISPAMLDRARERLGERPNVALAVADGQSLGLPGEGFNAVICNMGLMYFSDPARAYRSSTASSAPAVARPSPSSPGLTAR
jgi:ubiquinone/menaquinone biosynthesis C-methylase UbiE